MRRASWAASRQLCRAGSERSGDRAGSQGQCHHQRDPEFCGEGCAARARHGYFGAGQAEQAFAAFSQRMVQWKAFGDNNAYEMMQAGAQGISSGMAMGQGMPRSRPRA
jgi:hypothetical protein